MMKTHIGKRLLAVLLCAVMVLSSVNVQVFAAEEETCAHEATITVTQAKTEATCTEDGKHDVVTVCVDCGEVLSRKTVIDSKAAGHDYHETSRTAAAPEADGSVVYTCSVCGDSYTEKLPATAQPAESPAGSGEPVISSSDSESDDVVTEQPEAPAMMFALGAAPSGENGEITYVERSWNGTKVVSTTKSVKATKITASSDSWYFLQESKSSWFYVEGNVTMGNNKTTIKVEGNVNLILCDGATLTVTEGLYIPSGSSLTIYGQAEDSGKLKASHHEGNNAGIGGRGDGNGGSLVIHGGNIRGVASNGSAGIGGANEHTFGSITIYGGTVYAEGGTNGSGLGGGNKAGFGDITVYGGNVTAYGGSSGAGIGGGQQASNEKCGTVRIYGGSVNAYGGRQGAGIGGGEDRSGGETIIYGGTVYAQGGVDAAGIGGGIGGIGGTGFANSGNVTIEGGNVTAQGGQYGAGIGAGGDGKLNKVVINDGTVTATGGQFGAGIGGGGVDGKIGPFNGGSITINGGTIKAYGGRNAAGIGSGNNNCVDSITINPQGTSSYYPDVTAVGGYETDGGAESGAGIGGGANEEFRGSIAINGGVIRASAVNAAAIGSAQGENFTGNILIYATRDLEATSSSQGAGIGAGVGGNVTSSATITIEGGNIVASSYDGAGIGAGSHGNMSGKIKINGGVTKAYSHNGAGIGAGREADAGGGGECDGQVEITWGDVTAWTDNNEACAIGYGDDGSDAGKLSFGSYECKVSAGKDADSAKQLEAAGRLAGCRMQYCAIRMCLHAQATTTYKLLIPVTEGHSWVCNLCGASGTEAHKFGLDNTCECGYSEGQTFKIVMRVNGGIGEDVTEEVPSTVAYTIPDCPFEPQEFMVFNGWKMAASGEIKQPGDEVYITEYVDYTEYVELIAQWERSWPLLKNMIDKAENGGTVKLIGNVKASSSDSALVIPKGKTLTIDLNGYTIDRNLDTEKSNGQVFTNNGNLTIKDSRSGGRVIGGYTNGSGGVAMNYGTLTISGGEFYNNYAKYDGGAFLNLDGATLNIESGVIRLNRSLTGHGGAIMNYGTLNISGGSLYANITEKGNGGAIYSRGTLNITGGSIISNISARNGGGIHLIRCNANISGCEISNNSADESGGGIYIGDFSTVTISDCVISENKAQDLPPFNDGNSIGGGIYIYLGTLAMTDTVVNGNESTEGGGIYCSSGNEMSISSSWIVNNRATSYYGGGIVSYGKLKMTDSSVSSNNSYSNGGGMWLQGTATIENTEIYNNKARENGGGVSTANKTNLTMSGCNLYGNESQKWGGGLYLIEGATVHMAQDTNVFENKCVNNGGGIHVSKGSNLYISGELHVYDNMRDDTVNNLNVAKGAVVNAEGTLNVDSEVGVSVSGLSDEDYPYTFTKKLDGRGVPDIFVSDVTEYAVGGTTGTGGEAFLSSETVLVHFDHGNGTGTMEDANVVAGGYFRLPASEFTLPIDGNVFSGWKDKNGNIWNAGDRVLITGKTTFTAVYSGQVM